MKLVNAYEVQIWRSCDKRKLVSVNLFQLCNAMLIKEGFN